MKVEQRTGFRKVVKKLHPNQKQDLKKAIETIMADPEIGTAKKHDLSHLRIYKFKMIGQLMLLAYTYEADTITLTLLGLGSHENFYRDLKR